MEKALGVTQARSEFSTIVEQVQHQGDTYIIKRHGKPAAAVVPIQVYEAWKQGQSPFFDFIRGTQQEASLPPEVTVLSLRPARRLATWIMWMWDQGMGLGRPRLPVYCLVWSAPTIALG